MCKPCKGLQLQPEETVCTSHGTCSGDGYRTGNGKCQCEAERAGEHCEQCAVGFYALGEGSAVSCEDCDPACKDGCSGSGPGQCTHCADGFQDLDGTCQDINECAAETGTPCTDADVYCANTPGSYMCHSCDPACKDGCTGPDPTDCTACAEGYVHHDTEGCQDVDECAAGHDGCLPDQFCVNTPGSVECQACAAACEQGQKEPVETQGD